MCGEIGNFVIIEEWRARDRKVAGHCCLWGLHARDRPPVIDHEVATLLERYASQVTELPGVSRTNPHAFAEAKSELAGAMRADAKILRTASRKTGAKPGAIVPGTITVGRHEIRVETRRRA